MLSPHGGYITKAAPCWLLKLYVTIDYGVLVLEYHTVSVATSACDASPMMRKMKNKDFNIGQ